MNLSKEKSPYYIFINSGDSLYVLSKTGEYETNLSNALPFDDKLETIMYVEKYGYQKIATIRRVHRATIR